MPVTSLERIPATTSGTPHALPRLIVIACLLLPTALVPGLARGQSKVPSGEAWREQMASALARADKVMEQVQARQGLLARYQVIRRSFLDDPSPALSIILRQYMGWYLSFLGDYPAASAVFSIPQHPHKDDRPSPLADSGYRARPAVDALAELASHYRVVLFNEAHNVPLTRSVTVQMLGRLRHEGFGYFAVETLDRSDRNLQTRGYPVESSGFYTEEPVYAEMVRTALKLGYKVIAYESGPGEHSGDPREAAQARNIFRQVFENDPHARLVVNAGYGHILESGAFLGGRSMAEHLKRWTNIPMLSVEQTMLFAHASKDDDHPVYTAVMKKIRPSQPIVFMRASGKPWSLRPGYDVSVFFPPSRLVAGRPGWLRLGGLRRPYVIHGGHCKKQYPCLVEARYSDEGTDAIPADRLVLVRPTRVASGTRISGIPSVQQPPSGTLYLRPGNYRLRFVSRENRTLYKTGIKVAGSSPSTDKR
jgi:hypothetical protein